MTKPSNWYKEINESLDRVDGKSPMIEDRLFWLSTPEAECAETIEAIDQRGDPRPFLDWLQRYLPEETFEHVENLFERKRLVNKNRGRPATASYDATLADRALLTGMVLFAEYRRMKIRRAEAIRRAAGDLSIPPKLLEDAINRKRPVAHASFANVKSRE